MSHQVSDLAGASFVSLTTFRRSGEGVPTPVWVAADGHGVVVTTVDGSGKVKRLRNNPDVTLRACDRRGRVADGAPSINGVVEVVTEPARIATLTEAIRRKYRLEFRVVMLVEKIVGRGRRRIVLRITDPA